MREHLSKLVAPYDRALAEHGVTPEGILWPNATDLATRFEVLLGHWLPESGAGGRLTRLLDLACGPGFLLDFLEQNELRSQIEYTGVDVSASMIDVARARRPSDRFILRDVTEAPFEANEFDIAIMCGLFTVRFDNTYAEMETFAKETLSAIWPSVQRGLCFNVMANHVDWERDDLFHWPLDEIMKFCKSELSRYVSLRLDYGLWETAVFVSREPVPTQAIAPAAWFSRR
jgi:SAM-dependent methyltransferase